MSILGMTGFEARATARDLITVISGSWTYSASVPADSSSTQSLTAATASVLRRPWHNSAGGVFSPSGGSWWFGFRTFLSASNSNNDSFVIGCGDSGTEGLTISFANTSNLFTLRTNGVVRATAATAAYSVGSWERVMVRVTNYIASTSMDVDVYIDGDIGTPIITYSVPVGEMIGGKPNEFWVEVFDTVHSVDDMWAMDPLDATAEVSPSNMTQVSIKPDSFTGNGNYTAWAGDYTGIDELPASDADSVTASVTDARETWTHGVINEPQVLAVQMLLRVTRTGTAAGSQIEITMRESAIDDDRGVQSAPGDGDVMEMMNEKRGGGTWTSADYDATEFGIVSRT